MKTVDATAVERFELEWLNRAVRDLPDDSELGAALTEMADSVRAGTDVVVAGAPEEVTPAQAARILGMSRTHLYKVMDTGDLPFVRVGRDRRIAVRDVVALRAAREDAGRQLAETFAHQDALRTALIAREAGVDEATARRYGY